MYSLLIDTHFKNIIIVLYKNGLVIDKSIKESSFHSISTMPMINDILINNNIDIHDIKLLLVVNGPGSFTGVRIGVTIAKMLASTLNCPIKSIDSLLIQAINLNNEEVIVTEEDQNGYYYGIFKNNTLIGKYNYLKKKEFNDFINSNDYIVKKNIEIDYNLVYKYLINKEEENVHSVNPLYIKDIEV